ncbi:MAG: transposase, partial [Gammaproteobacteria bacterium]|nr:transposase [Gammaproteobacteria bacterium]
MKRFVKQFGIDCIAGILGDREFIDKDWLDWLNKNGIRFLVRIKANQVITNARGLEVDVSALFYGVKTHEIKDIRVKRKFSGMEVYLLGTRDQNGELLVVASNM